MNKQFRLTRTRDFERIKKQGKVVYHPLLVLGYDARKDNSRKIAVVAGKSIGNAVNRNKTKRLIRACLRKLVDNIKEGWDLVFFSRSRIVTANYRDVLFAVESLIKKADLWQETV